MPKYAYNYKNTSIYKIVCRDVNIPETYVGHTTNFVKRKHFHHMNCIDPTSKSHNLKLYVFIRNQGGWENWDMIEIEKYPCDDINEAKKRERYWIEELKAELNSSIPLRTKKEYRDANIDRIKAQDKKYCLENADKIKERRTELYLCECGKEIQIKSKSVHIKTKHHLDFLLGLL